MSLCCPPHWVTVILNKQGRSLWKIIKGSQAPRCCLSPRLTPEHPRAKACVPPGPASMPTFWGQLCPTPRPPDKPLLSGPPCLCRGLLSNRASSSKIPLERAKLSGPQKGHLVLTGVMPLGLGGRLVPLPLILWVSPILVSVSHRMPRGLSKGRGPTAQTGQGISKPNVRGAQGRAMRSAL